VIVLRTARSEAVELRRGASKEFSEVFCPAAKTVGSIKKLLVF
jgi:hypothetical protein